MPSAGRPKTPREPARPPTIRDVAERAGVATATVSNVLTGKRQVAEDRRRRVLEAVEALGYRPNHLAASLRRQQTRTIGIVVPDLTNPFFGGLVHRIEGLAAEGDYQILLVGSKADGSQEADRVRALLARRIDGLIMVPARDDGASFAPLAAEMPPTVLVDRAFGLAGFDTVGADDAEAGHRGCGHLLQLGHRQITMLATSRELANMRDRIAGYRRALAEAGTGGGERLVTGGFSIEGCRAAIEQELRRADRPSAIFAGSYEATLGAIKAIRALDLGFPKDVSLLGFDESDWMTVLRPYVSTIVQPVEEMALEAWRLLIARLSGEDDAPIRVRLPCALQIRESTRPPAAAGHREGAA